MNRRWEVQAVAMMDRARVEQYLSTGWEPFAVVYNGNFNSLFLRRRVAYTAKAGNAPATATGQGDQ